MKGNHATTVNKDAAALLAALGLEEGLTLAEANADGYYTVPQIASMTRGVSEDAVGRAIRKGKFESVRIVGRGALRAYRAPRKP